MKKSVSLLLSLAALMTLSSACSPTNKGQDSFSETQAVTASSLRGLRISLTQSDVDTLNDILSTGTSATCLASGTAGGFCSLDKLSCNSSSCWPNRSNGTATPATAAAHRRMFDWLKRIYDRNRLQPKNGVYAAYDLETIYANGPNRQPLPPKGSFVVFE